MSYSVCLIYILGAAVRFILMNSEISSTISSRVEISTPLNSWLRVKEGVFLHNQGISVYSGGVFHGTPIDLIISRFFIRWCSDYLNFIFIAFDLVTAALLTSVAVNYSKHLLKIQNKEKSSYVADAESILLRKSDLTRDAHLVTAAFLLNPYAVVSCVAFTTTTFSNFVLAAALHTMLQSKSVQFGSLVALATYQGFYPVCLLVPGILWMAEERRMVVSVIASFVATLAALLWLSAWISGGWDFLEATYGFILSAPDLTPNIGLFWYFFTEMFEHFRLFFLATFQLNAFVYVLPLATKLRRDPVLLAQAMLALSAVFRSYPSLGDVALYMALLPLWKHLYAFLRQTFLVGCMLVSTSVLGPIMYNLWIFNGSANANFYFAVTLAFNTAQIFLVTDLLFAHVKRQYHLFHGSKLEVDGQKATLALE